MAAAASGAASRGAAHAHNLSGRHQQLVLAASVYISEGRSEAMLRSLEALARSCPGVVLANLFVDRPYNRTGYTLTSTQPSRLSEAASSLAQSAIRQVDLTCHQATHPRLGVADHICVQPLTWPDQCQQCQQQQHCQQHCQQQQQLNGSDRRAEQQQAVYSAGGAASSSPRSTALHEAAACARSIGVALSALCPVYYYGAAHPDGRRLADVRRRLGYFKPDQARAAIWEGALGVSSLAFFPPDAGPVQVQARTGVCTIGAVPFIVNYNVPLVGADFDQARAMARAVSERGGGLPHVEAMALNHGSGCIEVACNLLDVQASPPEAVQRYLEDACRDLRGVQVKQGYTTGKSAEELTEITLQALNQM